MGINKSGNTNRVISTRLDNLPNLPTIDPTNHSKVFTRHYVNLIPSLPLNEVYLLNFIVYQSDVKCEIKYGMAIMRRFIAWMRVNRKEINIHSARELFIVLIEKGLVFQTKTRSTYMINPMLIYHPKYIDSNMYKWIIGEYQVIQIATHTLTKQYLIQDLTETIEENIDLIIKAKKPRK